MKMFKTIFMGIAALVAATSFVVADQRIQDNLLVDGTFRADDGILPADNSNVAVKSVNSCGVPAQVSTAGTDATPVATTFYYAQIYVPARVTVTGVSVFNGTVASGNIKVGLADSTGAIIATSASTTMSGTDAYQAVPFVTPVTIREGTYYILEFIDNTTARVNMHTLAGTCVTGTVATQVFATGFTAFTPATSFTTAVGPIGSLY